MAYTASTTFAAPASACLDVAVLLAERRFLRVEPGLQQGRDLRAVHRARSAPSSQTIGSAASAVFACYHLSATTATALSSTVTTWRTPGIDLILSASKRLQLAAEHRALRDRRVQHAGQLHVDARTPACRDSFSAVSSRFTPLADDASTAPASFSFTSVGTGSFAASAATSP